MSKSEKSTQRHVVPRVFGAVLILVGLALLIGGIRLATLGGSWYYLLAGVATLVSGVLFVRANAKGGFVYLAVVVATVIWSLYEVGGQFWGLVPRLAPVLVLGLLAALVMRSLRPDTGKLALPAAAVQAVALAVGAVGVFTPHSVVSNAVVDKIVNDVAVVTDPASADNRITQFGRDHANTRFAPFDQINVDNVDKLEVAWTYRTGATLSLANEEQNAPIQIGNMMYLCTPENKVIALDATTGEEKWTFAPSKVNKFWNRCRGVGYFEVPAEQQRADGHCNTRIITTDKQARLWAVDAQDGKMCEGFGDSGKGYSDLSAGMGPYKDWYYMHNSQPLVADGRAIIGGWVWDGLELNEPSGVIRAYNLVDGSLDWAWDLGNPEITKMPPEGETYTKGTPNFWSHGAFDAELGLIYLPLGNPTPDFWGAHRTPEMNKYGTSLVALDVKTGREAWHFQTVHLDLWDYDNATPPTLMDAPDGTPALVMGTKTHQLFMLDRRTGKPLAEVQERPVPADDETFPVGDVPSAPTQPWSVGMPQLSKMEYTEADMWGATMFDQLYCRIKFKQLHYKGPYTRIGTKPTLVSPGYYGGYNWGGHAYDPRTNMLIVNDMNIPQLVFLAPRETSDAITKKLRDEDITNAGWKNSQKQEGTPYHAVRGVFNSFLGIPCNMPSWGNLIGIDMNTKTVAWKRPMGTVEDTALMGVKAKLPVPLGLPTLSAPSVTAGGVTFYVGTQDYYLRAFETASGKELWKSRLPVGSQVAPVSYLGADGRQYLIVMAGGARQSPDRSDQVIAYALPKQ